MKHLSILTLTMMALLGFMATTVQAQSPHFIRGPTAALTSDGDYCVSFKEAGLGNGIIHYTLTVGPEEFTFQCFTRHGNTPQGDPNGQSFSSQSTSADIPTHNGSITASLCLTPQQGTADCQGHGLVLKLIAVSYSAGQFCDATNNICVPVPPLSGQVVPPVPFP
jgi:hypothetical protein